MSICKIMRIKDNPIITKIGMALPFILAVTYLLTAAISTRKHIEDTNRYYKQYAAAFVRLNNKLDKIKSDSFNRINTVISTREEALAEIEDLRESVDHFEKIKPPRSLRDEHKAILNTISDERELLDALERVYRSETEKQLAENLSKIPMYNEKLFYSGFPSALLAFKEELDRLSAKQFGRRNYFTWI